MAASAVITIGSAVAQAAPEVLNKAMGYYRRVTGGKVTTQKQAIDFAKRGVDQASVIAQGLAQGGMPVNKILPPDVARTDPALQQLHTSLTQLYGQVGAQFDQTRLSVAGHADLGDTTRDVLRRDMALRLRRAFGNLENAEKIAMALQTMTHADFAWARAMGI
jgi:hypothetical protein